MIKKIVLVGNPNVGKSTIFNALTGLKQHTGNWSGKTVSLATGRFKHSGNVYYLTDLPGTYSIISNSPEEKIARDYICFEKPDLTVIVLDATCLERNLSFALQILEITSNALVCVNLLDEAKKNGIFINLKTLQDKLKVPVIGISARKKQDIKHLKNAILKALTFKSQDAIQIDYPEKINTAVKIIDDGFYGAIKDNRLRRFISLKLLDNKSFGKELALKNGAGPPVFLQADIACKYLEDNGIYPIIIRDIITETILNEATKITESCLNKGTAFLDTKSIKADKYLTSKKTGIPIMLLFFALILWITISGANYPSKILSRFFADFKPILYMCLTNLKMPEFLTNLLIDGVYTTTTCVVSVMLPPMAIFFPLFTLLENLGFLPRIAFNLDKCFATCNSSGKQALTMCMGLGCNAVGVTGCRIISSEKQRLCAMLTNTFMPCNGRFGLLITLSAIFIGGVFCGKYSTIVSALFVLLLIVIGVIATLLLTKLLSKTVLKEKNASFVLELPPFRSPQLFKTITFSFFDRTLKILIRAVSVSAPMGILIWIMANTHIENLSLIMHFKNFLDPFAKLLGLDGAILLAFILAIPANEIVLPIILMFYLSSSQMVDISEISILSELLKNNGWNILTAINVMLFSLLHFPCATTLKTIYAETKSFKWTFAAFIIPLTISVSVCFITNLIWNLFF